MCTQFDDWELKMNPGMPNRSLTEWAIICKFNEAETPSSGDIEYVESRDSFRFFIPWTLVSFRSYGKLILAKTAYMRHEKHLPIP